MNILLNILFLSLFTMAIIYFLINVENNEYLKDKLIIFITLFFFQLSLQIITKIINKCKIDIFEIANNCLRVAFAGTIGYSIYIDLTLMNETKNTFGPDPLNPHKSNWISSAVIILFITIVKVFELLLKSKHLDCPK